MDTRPTDCETWVGEVLGSVDRRDVDAFAAYLTEDARFRFANAPPTHGRAAAQELVAGFLDSLGGIRHRVDAAWDVGDAVLAHGEVTYVRKDGSELCVPFATVWGMQGERIADYRIFVDASSL